MANITYQNLFRMYSKLAGMTGTARTEMEEFREIYNMETITIPTNRPVARVDEPDLLYPTLESKFRAVVKRIQALHEKGQPVLVGTVAVETSEYLSHLLDQQKIPHVVLNAKTTPGKPKSSRTPVKLGPSRLPPTWQGGGPILNWARGLKNSAA